MVLLSGLQRLGNNLTHTSPARLLEQLDQYLREVFEAEQDKFSSSGAEGVLVCLNHQQKKLNFASARRPLWVQQPDGVIKETKPQRRILGQPSKLKQWEKQSFTLSSGSRLFLFSDGIPDEAMVKFDQMAAVGGSGFSTAFRALNAQDLKTQLQSIVATITSENLAYTAPAVSGSLDDGENLTKTNSSYPKH